VLEFVKDKKTKEPAPNPTWKLIDTAAQTGVLIGCVGVLANVIGVAPPVISEAEAHETCSAS
jgi:4-aminobutyrate aminotransferase-like enzyme